MVWVFGLVYWVLVGVFCVCLWVLVFGVGCWVILSKFLRGWVLGVGCWVFDDLVSLPQGLGVGCWVLGAG